MLLAPTRPPIPLSDWTPERIRALRKRLGYTQIEFASAMGYGSHTRISELENGKVEPTGPVCRLLDHLNTRGDLGTDEVADK